VNIYLNSESKFILLYSVHTTTAAIHSYIHLHQSMIILMHYLSGTHALEPVSVCIYVRIIDKLT